MMSMVSNLTESPKTVYFLSKISPDISSAINSTTPYPIFIGTKFKSSCMFHQSSDHDYLYTGKLCITSNILNSSYIKDLGEKEQIDTLICDSSIIDVPVDFNVQNAADKIESIIRNYSNMKIVISMDTFGMEDLLFEIACRGYPVYTGCSRNAFLRIQNADSYFTTSRDAVLRVVNKAFCVNIDDVTENSIAEPVKQEDVKVPDVLVKISSSSDLNLDSLTSYFNHQQPGPNDPYISLSNDILLKSKPEEVLSNRQKMVKPTTKRLQIV
ncbi:uncharacterized protein LOC113373778 [Ctenocephalides felis]|uniref:uncharacterized protein LOC113373778 n=1 Tax=Ctenocephalides felis TaxID=7515 RepID=UPI000E6E41C0|nr:uncharacterized protein LOC113373778 [Ctenocephalides felis]